MNGYVTLALIFFYKDKTANNLLRWCSHYCSLFLVKERQWKNTFLPTTSLNLLICGLKKDYGSSWATVCTEFWTRLLGLIYLYGCSWSFVWLIRQLVIHSPLKLNFHGFFFLWYHGYIFSFYFMVQCLYYFFIASHCFISSTQKSLPFL